MRSEQGILKRVFCVFLISNNREDLFPHHRRMPSAEFDESLLIAQLCRRKQLIVGSE
jgi:hypothetical protein